MRVTDILLEFAPTPSSKDLVHEIERLMKDTDPNGPVYQGCIDLLQQIISADSQELVEPQPVAQQPQQPIAPQPVAQQPQPPQEQNPEELPPEEEEEPLAEATISPELKRDLALAKKSAITYEEYQQLYDQLHQLKLENEQLKAAEKDRKEQSVNIKKFAKTIQSRIGLFSGWEHDLIGKLSPFGDELAYNFLKHCAAGTALTVDIKTKSGQGSFNLSEIVNDELKPMFDLEHRAAMKGLEQLATGKGGIGGGTGPGEGLFLCLLPGASKPKKSDIFYDGENWEAKGANYHAVKDKENPEKIKGVSNGEAWLECSGELKGSDLGSAFRNAVHPYIKNSMKKIVTWQNGNKSTVQELEALANFLPTGIGHFKYLMRVLGTDDAKFNVIDAIYQKIFPTVKKKKSAAYKSAVNLTIELIERTDVPELGRIQARLALYEYSINGYKSPNFIIYQPSTTEVIIIAGMKDVKNSLDDPNIECSPMTLGNRKKGSPGIFLGTTEENKSAIEQQLGFTRTRQATTRKAKVYEFALKEVDSYLLNR
jgi:hypothetical protein